jgi:uncharacterized protein
VLPCQRLARQGRGADTDAAHRWSPRRVRLRGLAGHPNCRDTFLAAAASAGIVLPVVPDPVDLFQDPGPRPDGTLAVGVAASSPGDAIASIARRDLVVIMTACPVGCPPPKQGHCSPPRIEISPAAAP